MDPAEDRVGVRVRAVPDDRVGARVREVDGSDREGVRVRLVEGIDRVDVPDDRVVAGAERVGARVRVVEGIDRVDVPDDRVVAGADRVGAREDGRPRITGMERVLVVVPPPLRVEGGRAGVAPPRFVGVPLVPAVPPGRVVGMPRTVVPGGRLEGDPVAGVVPRPSRVLGVDPTRPPRGVYTGVPLVGRVRGSRRTDPGVPLEGRDTGGTVPPLPIPPPLLRGATLPGTPGRLPSDGRGCTTGLQGSPTARSLNVKRGCLQTGGRTYTTRVPR